MLYRYHWPPMVTIGSRFVWGGSLLNSNVDLQRYALGYVQHMLGLVAMDYAYLTGWLTSLPGMEPYGSVGHSDPDDLVIRSRNQSNLRDNRLVVGWSPYLTRASAPRCRLFSSWCCKWYQGCGCSPHKEERELGSYRGDTGRILSIERKVE